MVFMSTPFVYLLRSLTLPAPRPCPDSDAELLDRFARLHDQDAFAALAARHGPMVLNACRRLLGDAHAAEDAFQATFLVLARRAGVLRRPEALAGWLYGVAHRVAREARRRDARPHRGLAEVPDVLDPRPDPLAELTARDLLRVVEEEVQCLPPVQRLPVVLCCFEGLSQEEAARRLGCTVGAVKGRLERGRSRLNARLVRRGLGLSVALAVAEGSGAARALPPALPSSMARAAALFAVAQSAAGGISGPAVVLAKGVLQVMGATKRKAVVAVVAALTFFAVASVAALLLAASAMPRPGQPGTVMSVPERQASDPGKDDVQNITGTWVATSVETDGQAAPEGFVRRIRFRFKNGFLVIKGLFADNREVPCDFKLDPKARPARPRAIDYSGLGTKQQVKGIYELDGERLKVCIITRPRERPTEFATKPGSNLTLIAFKRVRD
jgi:RNA polymerase sigma factor (sigma-70 family)